MHDSPEAVVQRQLDAYNARDIDALLATYAPDARQYEHPGTLLATGAAEMRDRMAAAGLLRTSAARERTLVALARGNPVRDGEAA